MIVSVCSLSCESECKLLLLLIYSLALFFSSSFQILPRPAGLYSPPHPPLPFRLTLDLCYCSESCDICDFNLPPWAGLGGGRGRRGSQSSSLGLLDKEPGWLGRGRGLFGASTVSDCQSWILFCVYLLGVIFVLIKQKLKAWRGSILWTFLKCA